MKLVIPVSRSDAHRLPMWVEAVKKFGGLESHSILFIPTFSVVAKAYEAAGKLADVCKDIRVSALDMDNEAGWPKASNWHWWSATQIMETLQAPWFWMELDCLPVRPNWATEIAGAYTTNGSPFMGCVVKTPWKNDKGQEVESLEGPDDKMMCGCGVYPSSLHARLKQIGQSGIMLSFTQGESSAELPWDLFLRHVMRNLGIGHTDLIGDYWNTQNYRIESGRLVCDPKPTDGDGKPVSVHRAGVVNPAAVVIHGCKDDSLFRLIKSGLDTRAITPIAPVVTPTTQLHQLTDTAEVAALRAQLDAQNQRFASLEALLTKVLSSDPKAPAVYAPTHKHEWPKVPQELPGDIGPTGEIGEEGGCMGGCPNGEPGVEGPPGYVALPEPDDAVQAILDCIRAQPASIRLSRVSELTGVPMNKIRALCAQEDSPFGVSEKASWMFLNKKKRKPAAVPITP